jgi:hypothetical protein
MGYRNLRLDLKIDRALVWLDQDRGKPKSVSWRKVADGILYQNTAGWIFLPSYFQGAKVGGFFGLASEV